MSENGSSWFGRITGLGNSISAEQEVTTGQNAALGQIQELADVANSDSDRSVRSDALDQIHNIRTTTFRGTDMTQSFYDRNGYPELKQEIQDASEGRHAAPGAPTRDWVTGETGTQGPYKGGKG